jgi:hypothetical protein
VKARLNSRDWAALRNKYVKAGSHRRPKNARITPHISGGERRKENSQSLGNLEGVAERMG